MSITTDTPVVLAGGTKITWTHFTFNPWWGCTKVSPACNSCYADTFAHRLGMDLWGKSADRRTFGDKHWAEPLKWQRKAVKDGTRYRVFCASMSDVFENRRDLDEHRARLWRLIDTTPDLDWMLLTKRPEAVPSLIPPSWAENGYPANVWVGTTVEDQASADLRIPRLARIPAQTKFVSCEPLLGPVEFPLDGIDLVIAGGESGRSARQSDLDWFRSLRDRCVEAGVAFHFKQHGEWLYGRRLGVASAGRVLDGRTWDEMPVSKAAVA